MYELLKKRQNFIFTMNVIMKSVDERYKTSVVFCNWK